MRIALRVTCIALLSLTRLAQAQVTPIAASPIPIVDSLGKPVGNYHGTDPIDGKRGFTLFDLGDGRMTALQLTFNGFDQPGFSAWYTSSDCSGRGYVSVSNSSQYDPWLLNSSVGNGHQGASGVLYAPRVQQPTMIKADSSGYPGACNKISTPQLLSGVVPFVAITDLGQLFTPPFYLVTLPAPTFFPPPGTDYAVAAQVALHAATSGATIYYTTDGSTPTPTSAKYTGKIDAYENMTINAIAVSSAGYTQSPVATAFYGIRTGGVTFSPPPGKYSSAQQVTLTGPNSSVAIYYTNDGSTLRHLYKTPISVTTTITINAFAQAEGYEPSLVATATYTIGP